jgi:hypothetical protein
MKNEKNVHLLENGKKIYMAVRGIMVSGVFSGIIFGV